jgi:malyl-CoA/(S)-citramalyl-CoA lyase
MAAPSRTRSRCVLAVPAHRADIVAKAAASAADAVYLDLEGAVRSSEKAAALDGAVLAVGQLDWGTKRLAIRLNAALAASHRIEVGRLAPLGRLDAVILT